MSITKTKVLFKNLFFIFVCTLFSLLFFGCENFLKSENVKEEILEKIAYNNAKSYQIRVECSEEFGVILTDTILTKKETDVFKIEFRMATGLQFLTWKAYAKDDNGNTIELSSDYIEFIDYNTYASDNIYKATIKFKKNANDITIKPICLLIPKVESITPVLVPSGYEQDSSITITFNKPVDTKSFGDFSCITIESTGKNLKDYFLTPVFSSDNTVLTIYPNTNQLLIVPDSGEKMDITVSLDLSDAKDFEGLNIAAHNPHTYRINDSVGSENLILQRANVEVTGTNGKFNPAKGVYKLIQTYPKELNFEPDGDYGFVYWKIYDKNTDVEIPNGQYINIQNPSNENTIYTLVQAPAADSNIKLTIKPVVAERPQVISNSPQTSGVRKDTSIQVFFDHDMDKASIYWTEDEMQQMLDNNTADQELFPESIIDEEGQVKTIYKGYKKGDDVFFKNILITNNKTGKNINKFYAAPEFDNSRSLIIRVKREIVENEGETEYVVLVPNYTQILVSIEKGMSYLAEGKPIEMMSYKRWMYHVGDSTDSTPLDVAYTLSHVQLDNNDLGFIDELNNNLQLNDIKNLTFMKGNRLDLELKLKVDDPNGGSGPKSFFKIQLNKIYDQKYNKLESSQILCEKSVDYNKDITPDSASYEGNISLTDLHLPEGIYELDFVFDDLSGNSNVSGGNSGANKDKKYYIAVDKTAPSSASNLKRKYKTSSTIELSWNAATNLGKDFAGYEVSYSTSGNSSFTEQLTTELSKVVNYDAYYEYYTFSVCAVDAAGNKSSVISTKTYTKAMKGCDFVDVAGATVTSSIEGSDVFKSNTTYTFSDLLVCDHEVTQKEYETYCAYTHYTPGDYNGGVGDNYPVRHASWFDAIIYCNLRSNAEGLTPVYSINGYTYPWNWPEVESSNGKYHIKDDYNVGYNSDWDNVSVNAYANGYRLPTHAEWEYLARGGNPIQTLKYSGSNNIGEVAWYSDNVSSVSYYGTQYKKLSEVKKLVPNRLGIYDMCGNAPEWTFDYYNASNVAKNYFHYVCGGSYTSSEDYCKVSSWDYSSENNATCGFRVVRKAE